MNKAPSPDPGALHRVLDALHAFFAALRPTRFSLLMIAGGVIAFLLVDQGQDVLRRLAESDAYLWFAAISLLAVWAWTLSAWYWARTLLSLERWETGSRLRVWLPRILGTLGWLGWTAALARACRAYHFDLGGHSALVFDPRVRLAWLAVVSSLMTVAFLGLVIARRRMFKALLAMPEASHRFPKLQPRQRWIIKLNLVVSGVLLVLFTVWPVALAPSLGTVAIVLITLSIGIFVGTVTVLAGDAYGIPIVSLGLLAALLFSPLNDNHAIRTLEGTAQLLASRPTLSERLARWTPESGPIFVVAAEGGGIRAGYWAAQVLGALQASNEGFSRHIFAISGVSGGSLGAGVFAALTAEGMEQTQTIAWRARAKRILARDFLSPALGMLFGPDAVQRFLPLPIGFLDRSRALEEGWASAWQQEIGNDRLERGFLTFSHAHRGQDTERPLAVPSLVFNTTHVGSGKRWLESDLDFGDELPDAGDLLARLGTDTSLATAIHNSARFLYISPAGRAVDARGRVQRVVDGGYFENFGATTARQITEAIAAHCSDCARRVVVIAITNGELGGEASDRFANELLAPIRTLLRTRSARGSLSLAELKHEVEATAGERGSGTQGSQSFFRFALCGRTEPEDASEGRKLPLPLGWGLSKMAQEAMDRQIDPPEDGVYVCPEHRRNLTNLHSVAALLAASPTPVDEAEAPEGR